MNYLRLFVFLLALGLCSHAYSEEKTVLLAILARDKAHVLERYLECIENQDYNKKLISIYINTNNNQDNTEEILTSWADKNRPYYEQIVIDSHNIANLPSTDPHDWKPVRFKALGTIRQKSMQKTKEYGCDYYFVVDCDNFISPDTLKTLVKQDKPIIAPLLRSIPEPGDSYSNYFCATDDSGYYRDHPDYIQILNRSKVGTFQVPVVHCTYLINANCIDKLTYLDGTDDYEFVIFSRSARNNGIGQYICNEKEFGSLVHFYSSVSLEEEARSVKNHFKN